MQTLRIAQIKAENYSKSASILRVDVMNQALKTAVLEAEASARLSRRFSSVFEARFRLCRCLELRRRRLARGRAALALELCMHACRCASMFACWRPCYVNIKLHTHTRTRARARPHARTPARTHTHTHTHTHTQVSGQRIARATHAIELGDCLQHDEFSLVSHEFSLVSIARTIHARKVGDCIQHEQPQA